MTQPLPEWPKIEPELTGKSFRQQVTEWNEVTGAMNRYYANECCYFADDADQLIAAYAARLRVAVEALRYLDGLFPDLDDKGTVYIRETLALIGPLPDLPPPPNSTKET